MKVSIARSFSVAPAIGLAAAMFCGCASPPPRTPPAREHGRPAVETFEERYARLMGETRPAGAPAPAAVAPPVAASPALDAPDADFDARYARLLSNFRRGEPAPPAAVPETRRPARPPARPPAPPSGALTIQPEAVLKIAVEEDRTLNGNYAVNEIGAINFGYVGPIILFNRTEAEAAEKIGEILLGRAFKNATVTVEIMRASYDRVHVSGSVNRPGLIRIGAGDVISLNDAILRAGGLSGVVRGMQARVLRDGLTDAMAMAYEGEVYGMITDDGVPAVPDVWLGNNDKVVIFSSRAEAVAARGDKTVTVLGEVQRAGVYRFSGGEPSTVLHLVFKMGGFPPYANRRAIRIMRFDENGVEREIVVNAERILETGHPEDDVALEHGDRVIVPARRISLF